MLIRLCCCLAFTLNFLGVDAQASDPNSQAPSTAKKDEASSLKDAAEDASKNTQQDTVAAQAQEKLSPPQQSDANKPSSVKEENAKSTKDATPAQEKLSPPQQSDVDGKSDDKDKKDEANPTIKAAEDEQKKDPRTSQNWQFNRYPLHNKPAPLFGFGGNIIDKGQVQLFFFADEFFSRKKLIIDLIPNILFGITENFSVIFEFPFTPRLRDGRQKSSGLEDFFVQLEYAFYTRTSYTYVDQATLVTNITVPTGSIHKNPPTGFGAPSLFLGATYNRTYVDWFLYTQHGAILTTSEHGTKVGDQFLYQLGFGRNFPSPPGCIYAWMIEVDGQYSKKSRISGAIDPNSGGNVIYVTPSLWISSKDFLVQFGVSLPVNQHFFGKQRKVDYALNFNCAWSFY